MGRIDSWDSKLIAYVDSCRDKSWRWGSHDCATFTIKGVELILGESLMVPKWNTKAEADELLADKSMAEYVSDFFPEIDVSFARNGDVVAVPTETGFAIGLMMSPRAAFASKDGLSFVPRKNLVKAWRV